MWSCWAISSKKTNFMQKADMLATSFWPYTRGLAVHTRIGRVDVLRSFDLQCTSMYSLSSARSRCVRIPIPLPTDILVKITAYTMLSLCHPRDGQSAPYKPCLGGHLWSPPGTDCARASAYHNVRTWGLGRVGNK